MTFPRVLALALVATTCLGCEDDLPAPDATYTVRGEVRGFYEEDGDEQLSVHHERIDDFRDREGQVSGMDAMTMQFTVGDDVSLGGIEVGDPVEMTFEVRWSGPPMLRVTALRELPAGTELHLDGHDH